MSPEKAKFTERLIDVVTLLRYPVRGRQTQLAERYHIKQPSVRKWFTGDAMPSYEIALDLCKRAMVSYEWLMSGRGVKFVLPDLRQVDPIIEQALRVMQDMDEWERAKTLKVIETMAEQQQVAPVEKDPNHA